MTTKKPVILSIGGSDSGGGAGIQADIKTISALGGFATTVVTCTTAQSLSGVSDVHVLPIDHISAQLAAVFASYDIAAIKTGMLFSKEVIKTVADYLSVISCPVVIDPVMVSRSGDQLIADDAIMAYIERLFPLATVVTPNRYEAKRIGSNAANQLADLHGVPFVVKNTDEKHTDKLGFPAESLQSYSGKNAPNSVHTHGTGCTHSAAVATFLGQGKRLQVAVQEAKSYVTECLLSSCEIATSSGQIAVVNHA